MGQTRTARTTEMGFDFGIRRENITTEARFDKIQAQINSHSNSQREYEYSLSMSSTHEYHSSPTKQCDKNAPQLYSHT